MSASKNLAASVQARLLNIAKAEGRDYGQVLTKFALERQETEVSALFSAGAAALMILAALLSMLWFQRRV